MADKKASLIISLVDQASAGLDAIRSKFDDVKNNVVALGASFAGLSAFVLKSVSEFGNEELVVTRLNAAMAQIVGTTAGAASRLIALAQAQASVTAYSKDEIISAETLLANHKMTERQISALIPILLDLATVNGRDLVGATTAVARAIDSGSNQALRRMGIEMDATTLKTHNLDEIVGVLASKAPGVAQAFGSTAAGSFQRLGNEADDAMKKLGAAMSQVLLPFANVLEKVVLWISNLSEKQREWIAYAVLGATAVTGLAAGAVLLTGALTALTAVGSILATIFGVIFSSVGVVAVSIVALSAAVAALWTNFAGLRDTLVRLSTDLAGSVGTALKGLVSFMLGDYQSALSEFKTAGQQAFQATKVAAQDAMNGVGKAVEMIKNKFSDLTSSIKVNTSNAIAAQKSATQLGLVGVTQQIDQANKIVESGLVNITKSSGEAIGAMLVNGTKSWQTALLSLVLMVIDAAMEITTVWIALSTMVTASLFTGPGAAIAALAALAVMRGVVTAVMSNEQKKLSSGGSSAPQAAEGGIVMPTAGGTLVNIGEAGHAEAIIPLNSSAARGMLGGMGGGVTVQVGTLIADQAGLEEFARRLDKVFWRLKKNNQTVAV